MACDYAIKVASQSNRSNEHRRRAAAVGVAVVGVAVVGNFDQKNRLP
jgi:hypothetical protein